MSDFTQVSNNGYSKPLPLVTRLNKPFWDGTKRHVLLVQICKLCSTHFFPPSTICIECGSREIEWVETKGRGVVYTFTVIHQDLNRGFGKEVPYALALVELDEGFRIYSILANDPEEVSIGARASVIFEDVTPEISLYKFKVDS